MKLNSYLLGVTCTLFIGIFFCSCEKTSVTFEPNQSATDPNIIFIDSKKVEIGTEVMDSFITSNLKSFMVGSHNDPYFGKLTANSYAEIALPDNNPLFGKDILFDSICIRLQPTGKYYGDTTVPLSFSVNQVTQPIENDADLSDVYYFSRTFHYQNQPLASVNTIIDPSKGRILSIRLPDTLGSSWAEKFRTNAYEVQSQARFRNYFNGIIVRTDSLNSNNIFYFSPDSNDVFIRLYYKERGLFNTAKQFDFKFIPSKQFVNLTHNYTSTIYTAFTSNKKEWKSSTATNNRAFMQPNNASFITFSFPDLLSIKELYPYVKVVKAELELKPAEGTYNFPYQLPKTLLMYISDEDNSLSSVLFDPVLGTPQTGNLVYDPLNYVSNHYTFDITSFITTLIAEGIFTEKSLLLTTNGSNVSVSERLILNNQLTSGDVKLKLYVLGL